MKNVKTTVIVIVVAVAIVAVPMGAYKLNRWWNWNVGGYGARVEERVKPLEEKLDKLEERVKMLESK